MSVRAFIIFTDKNDREFLIDPAEVAAVIPIPEFTYCTGEASPEETQVTFAGGGVVCLPGSSSVVIGAIELAVKQSAALEAGMVDYVEARNEDDEDDEDDEATQIEQVRSAFRSLVNGL